MTGCLKFLAELEGDWIGDGKLTFESEQAAREYRLLKRFILVRAAPFLNFWNEAIYALDSGDALTIKPEELQRWNDT